MRCPLCQHHDCPPFARADERDYFRCLRCELTFLHPQQLPAPDVERTHYDLHENRPDDPGYRAFLDHLATPLCQQLKPGSEGLDFGCGPGPALARMLEERGHHMALYDPVFAPDRGPLERQYDFVTCTEVVEHFHHPDREFRLLADLTRPGGTVAIMTSLLQDGIDFQTWHYRRDPTHVCFYRPTTFHWIGARHKSAVCYLDNVRVILLKRQ